MSMRDRILSRADAKFLMQQVETHLATWAEDNGYDVRVKSCSMGHTFRLSLEIAARDEETGRVETQESADFESYRFSHGLPATVKVGTKFTVNGSEYTITGFRARARKRPILCERADGKSFVFATDSVRRLTA